MVHLDQAESFDFLGFTFRYDPDLYGGDKTYLNVVPLQEIVEKGAGYDSRENWLEGMLQNRHPQS